VRPTATPPATPPATSPAYAELHCRSNFSFLTGASQPEELVVAAHGRGYAALAITDECSLAGVVRAHGEAQRLGLHLVIGAQMQLTLPAGADGCGAAGGAAGGAGCTGAAAATTTTKPPRTAVPATPPPLAASSPLAGQGAAPRLLLLAQDRQGYGNLAQWISVARRRAAKGCYLAHPSDLEGGVPNAPFLAGLGGCFAILLPEATQPLDVVFAHAMWLKTWFGVERCAIAIELLHRPHDALRLDVLPRVAALAGLPLVACGDVLMHSRARKPLLDVLTATRVGRPVADCGFALQPNAEAHLRSRQRLAELYAPAWLAASVRIAAGCTFSLAELRYEYPEEIVPAGHTPDSWLRQLTDEGARRRYPGGIAVKVSDTIAQELALIAQLGFAPYFLTVADIVHWARSQGVLCQGRGSAANSVVCYCLGATGRPVARAHAPGVRPFHLG